MDEEEIVVCVQNVINVVLRTLEAENQIIEDLLIG